MRRKDRQIHELEKIEAIIGQARVCRLALHDLPAPYVVPMSFGYQDQVLYFHAAGAGRKLELLRQNPQVGFEISIDLGDVDGGEQGCEWSVNYRSVNGYGRVSFIDGLEEKRAAFNRIMAQYAQGPFSYPQGSLERTLVFQLAITSISGKASHD